MTRKTSLYAICPDCATLVDLSQQDNCPECNAAVAQDADRTLTHNPDTTIRIATPDPDATIRVGKRDADATIRYTSRQAAHLYLRALEISHEEATALANSDTSALPAHEQASSVTDSLSIQAIPTKKKRRVPRWFMVLSILLLLLILFLIIYQILARVHDPSLSRQAQQNRARVDQLVADARASGVPATFLNPVAQQEYQIETSLPWYSPSFYLHPADTYSTQAEQYAHLSAQIPHIVSTAKDQLQAQAEHDLQQFQFMLSQRNMHPTTYGSSFAQQFAVDQVLMGSAQEPRDYIVISQDIYEDINALNRMDAMSQQLAIMQSMLATLTLAHLDTATLQQSYQKDLDALNTLTKSSALQGLQDQLDTHSQQILSLAMRAFPAVLDAKLQNFMQQIDTLKSYGKDTAPYLQLLEKDRTSAAQARTTSAKTTVLQNIDRDIASMQNDLARGDAQHQVAQFHQEVDNWGKANLYHNLFDGKDYPLDAGYMQDGTGSFIDADLTSASSLEDFKAVTLEAQNALFNLQMLEADSGDKASYDQVHASDSQLLDHYQLHNKQVLMISLAGQAMRVYQDGHLQRAFQVVTGRQQRPSPPGVWQVLDRKSPTTFISGDPQGSPYWFPPTPINYAILYHYGGDYIHDATWRATFGPGAQFPHQDAAGNTAYNFDGSHGCVNLSEPDMTWLYTHTDWHTTIVVY